MKRQLSFLFLLITNFLLLTHEVLPNPLYEKMTVCSSCDNHNKNDEDNDDDGSDGIDDNYMITFNNEKSCRLHAKSDSVSELIALIPISFNLNDCVDNKRKLLLCKYYIVTYHTDFISQSLGLRAPPY